MATESDIRYDALLPATPEAAWEAITAGGAGWLWPMTVEPRVGGRLEGLSGQDVVTAWEPARHYAVRAEGADGWFNELDYRLEPRPGGTLLLYRHRTVFAEDFENQYDACRQHTSLYNHTLCQYLEHFAGKPAAYVSADGPEGGAFGVVRKAIGLSETSATGDVVTFDVPGFGAVEATVDYLTPAMVGLRTRDALLRFYGRDVFGWPVCAAHHLFEPSVEPAKAQQAWENWLTGLYAG